MSFPGEAECVCSDCNSPATIQRIKLICQHCLCQDCLETLNKCPMCDKPISILQSVDCNQLSSEDLTSSTQEAKASTEQGGGKKEEKRSEEEQGGGNEKEFNESWVRAQSSYKRKKFKIGALHLEDALDNCKPNQKFKVATLLAMCLLESGKINKAKTACNEIIYSLNWNYQADQIRESMNGYDQNIFQIIEKLIEISEFEIALEMTRLLFKIIEKCYEADVKSSKLEKLGFWMKNLSIGLRKQNKVNKIKQIIQLMDEIYEEIREIQKCDKDDLETHTWHVVWFLRYFGRCCQMAKDYNKSKAVHEDANKLLRKNFQDKMHEYKVVSFIYNNLGLAYEAQNELAEAKNYYSKAIDIMHTAKDWISEEEKSSKMIIFTTNLKRVLRKFAKQ